MNKYHNEFPILKHNIYANTAASGIMYDSLLEWRQEHDLDFLIGGSAMKFHSHTLISETRKTVGVFFNCPKERVALVPNFSLGLNMLLEGLDKTHKVLLLENEYPSVSWPFERWGFTTHIIPIVTQLEQRIAEAIQKHGISILAVSVVQWINGIRLEVDFFKKLKTTYPNLIIIADGTQFCGTTTFNFNDSGIDVLGASAYKWLLAGYGNSFMLFGEGLEDKVKIKTIGYNSANGDITAKDKILFTKYFEPGHLDTFNFGSLKFSLDFLTKIGMKTIEKQNIKLSNKAKNLLGNHGFLEDLVLDREEHSTIFSIKGNKALFSKLEEENIICAQRGNGIRLSFHFYNTEEEIEQIVNIIKLKS